MEEVQTLTKEQQKVKIDIIEAILDKVEEVAREHTEYGIYITGMLKAAKYELEQLTNT